MLNYNYNLLVLYKNDFSFYSKPKLANKLFVDL